MARPSNGADAASAMPALILRAATTAALTIKKVPHADLLFSPKPKVEMEHIHCPSRAVLVTPSSVRLRAPSEVHQGAASGCCQSA